MNYLENSKKDFARGIKTLGKKRWDLLYLGCAAKCGHKDISLEKSVKTPFISGWIEEGYMEGEWYLKNKIDLRAPCEEDCPSITKFISHAPIPGGTWAYGVSLTGAKKILKLINHTAATPKYWGHIDQVYKKECNTGYLKCVAFDPPIVWHEGGAARAGSDIPW